MENHINKLLDLDLQDAQRRLQQILQALSQPVGEMTELEEGLATAHTLKALAAIKGQTHLEQFAAQLEQLFLTAQKLPAEQAALHLAGQIKTIQRGFKQACQLADSHTSTTAASKHLHALVERLHRLDEAHSQAAYQSHLRRLKPNQVSMESLFRSFVPWLNQAAEATQKSLQIHLNVPKPVVLPTQAVSPLQTILVHLLRNALFHGIESAPERQALGKTEKGVIEMSAELDGQLLILGVSDDGRGMTDQSAPESIGDELAAIFSSNNTGSAQSTAVETSIYAIANAQTGLGIGLHIIRSQVESLNGQLELKSIPGKGTSALCYLPLASLRALGHE